MNLLGNVFRHLLSGFLLLEVGPLIARSVGREAIEVNIARSKLADKFSRKDRGPNVVKRDDI